MIERIVHKLFLNVSIGFLTPEEAQEKFLELLEKERGARPSPQDLIRNIEDVLDEHYLTCKDSVGEVSEDLPMKDCPILTSDQHNVSSTIDSIAYTTDRTDAISQIDDRGEYKSKKS